MKSRQQGITAIGLILVAVFVGIFGFGILKVMPFYLEQMKVVSILDDVKRDLDGKKPSIAQIRSVLGKRLNIEMVTGIKTQDFKIRKTNTGGYRVSAQYERREAFLGNLYFVAVFDEQVEIIR